MFEGTHRPSITIEIGVNLDRSDPHSHRFQEHADARRSHTFSNSTEDPARHHDVFHTINGVYIMRALPINIGLVIPELGALRCLPPCSSSVRR